MNASDVSVFHWINGWPDWFSGVLVFFSEATKMWEGRLFLLAAFIVMLVRAKDSRKAALIALIAFPIANELCDVLKQTFPFNRPCVDLVDAIVRTHRLTSSGTASAHSANMAAIATVMFCQLGRWGWLWAGAAFLTGLSRIYVGVHYPSQVLFGWSCGILIGLVVFHLIGGVARYRQNRLAEPPDEQPEL